MIDLNETDFTKFRAILITELTETKKYIDTRNQSSKLTSKDNQRVFSYIAGTLPLKD